MPKYSVVPPVKIFQDMYNNDNVSLVRHKGWHVIKGLYGKTDILKLKCADDNIHIYQKKIVRHNGHQGYRYLEGSFWKTVQTLSNREFFQFYFLWFIRVP